MKKTNTFQDLIVWQKGHQFVLEIYNLSKSFPKEDSKLLNSYCKSILTNEKP